MSPASSSKSVQTDASSPVLQDFQPGVQHHNTLSASQFPPPPPQQGEYSFGIIIPYEKYWTYADDKDPLPPADQEHLFARVQKLAVLDRQAQRKLRKLTKDIWGGVVVDLCQTTEKGGNYFPLRVLAFCSSYAKNRQVTEEVLKKVDIAKNRLGLQDSVPAWYKRI
ncbi:hypothetical protein K435DRAFT_966440 [Dendrothele bispora CBS 962.96]|uniref:Uncharacterized protein n=1 Tax=Dendrothele bispora (strain CBS 962.96) TaxID=1314807 RepID=A0A4S8M0B7_DENBC|nr:hypothetical protein K435DRAFT_846013 [Dendrothele bispora CBS 962.96]THU95479.1 hypothetical protein K435DRAFT_966440 [Dendrothele bispora CBS 962.96]